MPHELKSFDWIKRATLQRWLYHMLPLIYCAPLLVLIACGGEEVSGGATAQAVDDVGPYQVEVMKSIDIDVLANDKPDPNSIEIDKIVLQDPTYGIAEKVGRKIKFTAKSLPNVVQFKYSVKLINGASSETYGTVTVKINSVPPVNPPPVIEPEATDDPSGNGVYIVPRRSQLQLQVLNNDKPKGQAVTVELSPSVINDNGQRSLTVFNSDSIIYNAYGGTGVVDDQFEYRLKTADANSNFATVKVRVVPSATAFVSNNSDSDVVFNFGADNDLPLTAFNRNIRPNFAINSTGSTTIRVTYKGQVYQGSAELSDAAFVSVSFSHLPTPQVQIGGGANN